jgi:hypothetical protein
LTAAGIGFSLGGRRLTVTNSHRDAIRTAMVRAAERGQPFDEAVYAALPELAPVLNRDVTVDDLWRAAEADYSLALLAVAQRRVAA